VTLAGHSMANLEMVIFAKEHPERLEWLAFLDSACARTLPAYREAMQRNLLKDIAIPGVEVEQTSIERGTRLS
jgi:pimeloyl-ACP methyl ester carboxylesterase